MTKHHDPFPSDDLPQPQTRPWVRAACSGLSPHRTDHKAKSHQVEYGRNTYASSASAIAIASDYGYPSPLTAAQALLLIDSWLDLTPQRRRHLRSGILTTARIVSLPISDVVLSPEFLRRHLFNKSPVACGISLSRLRGVCSAVRAVLERACVIERGCTPLTPIWVTTLDMITQDRKPAFISFARFCTRQGIEPKDVSERTFVTFRDYRTGASAGDPAHLAGRVRIAWNQACNHVAGWPGPRSPCSAIALGGIFPLTAFPKSFQQDLKAFACRLMTSPLDILYIDPDPVSKEARDEGRLPVRASTAALRQDHVRWAASALVMTGVPIEEITSVACLVTPLSRAQTILRYTFRQADNKPSARGLHIAEALEIILKYYAGLPVNAIPQKVETLKQWATPVRLKYTGMTDKNEACIQDMMTLERELALIELPKVYMNVAHKLLPKDVARACSKAMAAALIELLRTRSLRLGEIQCLRLDRHLRRTDTGKKRTIHINISAYETKNTVPSSAACRRKLLQSLKHGSPYSVLL